MKLKAFPLDPDKYYKKPKRMNEREYVLFLSGIIPIPENDMILFNTNVVVEAPQGFRIIPEPHPHMSNYQLVQLSRVREIKPDSQGPVMLAMSKLNDIVDLPARGQAIIIIRLEELSMPFDLEWNGELPDKKLTKITNLN
jgi:hypothetical protein